MYKITGVLAAVFGSAFLPLVVIFAIAGIGGLMVAMFLLVGTVWFSTREALGVIRRHQAFEDTFGVSPRDGVVCNRQEIVDAVLKNRAREFMKLCNDERYMLRRKATTPLSEEQKDELLSLQEEVRHAKDAFWGAHSLARRFGFEVRESVGDYILPE